MLAFGVFVKPQHRSSASSDTALRNLYSRRLSCLPEPRMDPVGMTHPVFPGRLTSRSPFDLPISVSPLPATLMGLPASIANKRLTGRAKPFGCNTYKKQVVEESGEIQIVTSLLPYLFGSRPSHCSAKPLVQQFPKARDFFSIRGNNSAPPGV